MEHALDHRVIRLETIVERMATKEDIANLRTELKGDIANLNTEIVRLEGRMFQWGVGLVVSNIGVAIAISFTAQKLLG